MRVIRTAHLSLSPVVVVGTLLTWLTSTGACFAQFIDATPAAKAVAAKTPAEDEKVIPAPQLPPPPGAKKLPKPDEVWVDAKKHQVFVDGYVSLREGYLEMLA